MKPLSTTFFVRQEQIICPQDIRLEENTGIHNTIVDMTLRCEMDTVANLIVTVGGTNYLNISDISLYERVIWSWLGGRIDIIKMSRISQKIKIDEMNLWITRDKTIKEIWSDKSTSTSDKNTHRTTKTKTKTCDVISSVAKRNREIFYCVYKGYLNRLDMTRITFISLCTLNFSYSIP